MQDFRNLSSQRFESCSLEIDCILPALAFWKSRQEQIWDNRRVTWRVPRRDNYEIAATLERRVARTKRGNLIRALERVALDDVLERRSQITVGVFL